MQTDQGRNHNYQPLNSNILEDRSSNRSINQRFGNLNIGSEHSQANQPLIGQVQDQISIQSQNQVVDPIRQVEDVQSQGDSQPPQQFMGFQERDQALEEIEERIKEKLGQEIYQRLKKEFQNQQAQGVQKTIYKQPMRKQQKYQGQYQVQVTENGSKYHKYTCEVAQRGAITQLPIYIAQKQYYRPCRMCF